MFVWICKASLPPNQALKVSKSQLLAPADGLTALLYAFCTHPEQLTRCSEMGCAAKCLRVDHGEKVRLVQDLSVEVGHWSNLSI